MSWFLSLFYWRYQNAAYHLVLRGITKKRPRSKVSFRKLSESKTVINSQQQSFELI